MQTYSNVREIVRDETVIPCRKMMMGFLSRIGYLKIGDCFQIHRGRFSH